MSATQQLLDVLRDARDEGLWQEQAAIVEELGLDAMPIGPTYWFRPARQSVRGSRGLQRLSSGDWITPVEASRAKIDRGLQRRAFAPGEREWRRSYLGQWAEPDS